MCKQEQICVYLLMVRLNIDRGFLVYSRYHAKPFFHLVYVIYVHVRVCVCVCVWEGVWVCVCVCVYDIKVPWEAQVPGRLSLCAASHHDAHAFREVRGQHASVSLHERLPPRYLNMRLCLSMRTLNPKP
jgi:hypothetical protein